MAEIPIVLGVIVGVVLGLTGAGGSVFAVPLLMAGLGWTLPQAAPVALIAVCAAATFGTIVAWDAAFVRYRAAVLMATAGFLTAPLGLKLGLSVPGPWLALAFAGVLVVVAVRMFLQAQRSPVETRIVRAAVRGEGSPARGPICVTNRTTGRLIWTKPCSVVIAGIGAVTGFLSGLLGVGGGFVIVPALRSTTSLSVHSAVATSLMAIALTSAGTVVATLAMGRPLPWEIAVPFVIGSLAGMLLGRQIAPHVVGPALQRGFAALMIVAAGVLAAKATS